MKITHEPASKPGFEPERADKAYQRLVKILQEEQPSVSELLVILSNLLYTVGAAVGDYKEVGPTLEELEKLYYSEPDRVDVALMLQGLMMSTWVESYIEKKSKS